MRRLELTEIARADLESIRRYSSRTWGQDRTSHYMATIRDTLKGLVRGTVITRNRDDLRPGLQMAISGRHGIFVEADQQEFWSFACSTTGWITAVTWRPKRLPTSSCSPILVWG